jgi:uncharacterized lipoprotein YmbA
MRLRTSLLPAVSLAALSFLVACGSSPPTRFYTLSELTPGTGAAGGAAARPSAAADSPAPAPVRLDPVSIPGELDRQELVTHEGPNRVRIRDSDRWAAPLDEQIRRVLSDDLAARLPPHQVADPNEPSTTDARRKLSIVIARFDASDQCAVSLRASWTLRGSTQGRQSGIEQIDVPATAPCPGGLPVGMSQALAGLADRLAGIVAAAP